MEKLKILKSESKDTSSKAQKSKKSPLKRSQLKRTSPLSFKTLRVKNSTKQSIDSLLTKINNSDDCGKTTVDDLVDHLLQKVTPEDIKELQLSSVTWVHEEKRLRKLFEKKNGKVSEGKWKQMLCMGELREFFKENSRLHIN